MCDAPGEYVNWLWATVLCTGVSIFVGANIRFLFLIRSSCADSTKASALTERYPFASIMWHPMVAEVEASLRRIFPRFGEGSVDDGNVCAKDATAWFPSRQDPQRNLVPWK